MDINIGGKICSKMTATMNYETAKKLRDAGFPQDQTKCYINCHGSVYWTRRYTPDPVYPSIKEIEVETERCYPADQPLYRIMCETHLRLAKCVQVDAQGNPKETLEQAEHRGYADVYIWLQLVLSIPKDQLISKP